MSLFLKALNFPNDSGPIYRETLAGRLPVEPFNTFSNILFLSIVIYFSLKVYKNVKQQAFLAFALPVLLIGFIGGTIYHATRSHEIWLLMDWVPIVILCLSASIYFTFKDGENSLQKYGLLVIVLLLLFGVELINWPNQLGTSIGYISTAIGLLLPMCIYLVKTNFIYGKYILFALLSFSAAISFRIIDQRLDLFEMGTHWLWHSFGAISVFFLMQYIYKDRLHLSSKNIPS
ncbi:ceramidase [Mesonia aestuariivivens]|uniref:Ceramidase n=1 Tax=Mesonia aestuariivivens TaxID=2796128 RepID=A0ABS6VXE1_9FLAO|nr:ceramidase [Mesonia aestuariivivens]MBW2960262.1 ceramidase [Mesonia aestuariivivens]